MARVWTGTGSGTGAAGTETAGAGAVPAGAPATRPSQLRWYAARLGAMSPREVAWRVQEGAAAGVRERRAQRRRPVGALGWGGAEWAAQIIELAAGSAVAVERDAERIASGWLDLWGTPVLTHPTRPRWRTHPFASAIWPRGSWRGWELDPKPIWEIHRHQHLVPLAAGAALADRPDWGRTAAVHVLDWIARNEKGSHPGWSSAYETAHRLVSWAFAVPLLGAQLGREERARVDESFAVQARFVASRPSRFSSANNHRLAELTGLLAAALVEGDDGAWRRAWRELEDEAGRQTFGDGGSREQAAGYFLYVLEMLTVCCLLARGRGEDAGGVGERVRAMLGWLDAVAGDDGEPPAFGDDAEDRMLRLDYFEPRSAVAIAQRARDAVDGRSSRFRVLQRPGDGASHVLRESGLAVFRAHVPGLDPGADTARAVVDVGELGYGRLAAHGHADALSLLLDVGGVTLLRDSGTGSYVRAEGREEYRRTHAHNTVTVDGASQAQALGPHLWGRRFKVTVESASTSPAADHVRASHDGFRALPARALHTRSVTFLKPDLIVVLDRVRARRSCDCTLRWHLEPGDTPASLGGGLGAMSVASLPAAAATGARARLSRRYASQGEAPVWTWTARGRDVVLATAIALGPRGTVAPPRLLLAHDDGVTVARVQSPRDALVVERWTGESDPLGAR